ncbi:MAG: Ldh family oxidoreductase [Hyphomicrobiaceae bacterium]
MKPASHVAVDHIDLKRFAEQAFATRGMAPENAEILADTLVWADLRDVGSHGVFRLPRYLKFMDRGEMDPKARIEPRLELPAALVFEANKAPGALAMMHATRAASERAKTVGLCYAIVSHTTHTGAIGYFAHRAAQRGFAAIVASAGTPNMAYHGARVPSISTSPVSIAVPGGRHGVIALDMSTAILGIGRLAQAKERGEPLPEGIALDGDGNPTTDAAKATTPLPLGGAKGSGLALMLECIGGLLAGSPILAGMIAPGCRIGHAHNGIVIVLDIKQFRPVADFEADLEELAAAVKSLPRRDGVDQLLLPGERGNAALEQALVHGARISAGTWAELEKISAATGIPLPAPKY